jgi:hypothetical protein
VEVALAQTFEVRDRKIAARTPGIASLVNPPSRGTASWRISAILMRMLSVPFGLVAAATLYSDRVPMARALRTASGWRKAGEGAVVARVMTRLWDEGASRESCTDLGGQTFPQYFRPFFAFELLPALCKLLSVMTSNFVKLPLLCGEHGSLITYLKVDWPLLLAYIAIRLE